MSAQCATTGPFLLSSLSGHSFFPVFHPIVFNEKGLDPHPQPARWLHRVLRAQEQQEGRVCRWGMGGLVTVYYSLVDWICEFVWFAHGAGWVAWVRAGTRSRQKEIPNTNITAITILFFFTFPSYSAATSSFTHLTRPGLALPCPQTQFLLGTYYPKHLLQCCVEVMCWLPYQEFSQERYKHFQTMFRFLV